ncbi:phthalate 4,5-cis-dihydrodiol dehydrogenase [Rhodobium orientis]|uniref:4,5-dihydroxyphthalate dehydrogenase n=1 Tax=Rhodobium orientis TaxID=34017 RepID=A0A327JZR2_9HYPH|nr:Gfo/Idh/MocA family oxidoreductase [Rhodobium orientis]MBB4302510.1 phthalate 4,5-cis-dihydrodiol dehydrogenase [Rhodobium orientis]MBK5949359.1 4,5-dihydroxyphthalate dehydrogenase [Rhodobium orientis]RAI28598.1 4,5-dihydroxyphthalate dehydrogenase [Rhodobium orientis]
MTSDPVRLGVAGLGRGFMLTLPSILADDHVRLVAAAAPRSESREAFVAEFGGRAYASVEELAADPDVEAVYIATPHQMHREHAEVLAGGGKHLLVEKPLAISMDDATAIVDATVRAGVKLVTGPSHSFDQPVLAARRLIDEGRFGRVRMIHALNYTDFLYRPRRPEELSTELGGGVVFSQAVHQVDVVRVLMGGEALTVSAMTGAWDPARPTEGAYAALIQFDGGRFANLVYSGYAHFDSDTWQDDIGELGTVKDLGRYGAARRALATVSSPEEEAALKSGRTFGAVDVPPVAPHAEHFGPIIVSCDRADLRLTAKGIEVWGDTERSFIATPADPSPRAEVLKGLHDAVRGNDPPLQSGGWGRASLELCHAILDSARTGGPVTLQHQS